VLDYLCEIIGRTFRPDLVAVLTRDLGSNAFAFVAGSSFVAAKHAFRDSFVGLDSPLPHFLVDVQRPLLLYEQLHEKVQPELAEAQRHLRDLGGQLAFPMFSDNELTGFLILGPKLSGDAYFLDDVELLSTLVSQAAIAVKNAQLYRQVVLVNDYVKNILGTMD